MIEIIYNILFNISNDTRTELTVDYTGSPQVVYISGNNNYYLTHKVNEGKYYFSKYNYNDDIITIDRINKILYYKNNCEDDSFNEIVHQIKLSLLNYDYVFKNVI